MTLIEIESYKLVVTNSFASEIESQRLVTPADLIALDSSENERRERGGRKREKWKKAFFLPWSAAAAGCVCFCVSLIGGYHLQESRDAVYVW
jgi:hypothetical protein